MFPTKSVSKWFQRSIMTVTALIGMAYISQILKVQTVHLQAALILLVMNRPPSTSRRNNALDLSKGAKFIFVTISRIFELE